MRALQAISAILMLIPFYGCLNDEKNFEGIWRPQTVVHLGMIYITGKAGGLF